MIFRETPTTLKPDKSTTSITQGETATQTSSAAGGNGKLGEQVRRSPKDFLRVLSF